MSRDIIIFRLTHGYILVAVKPCEKLVYECEKPSEFSKQKLVPYISVEVIETLTFESKAFSSRTILKIISKIGTYSYCTPLLICVGGCATVLVVWSLIILKYYSGMTSNGSSLGS